MQTFEITIQRKSGEEWPVVAQQSASGLFLPVRHEGTLRLDLVELNRQTTPKDYGTLLGQVLFRDQVMVAFSQALIKSDDRLHILLFVEDAELRALRWERLCAPLDGRWDFLGLDQRVPFSLYLPSLTDQRFPPIGRRDLRALVVVANPEDPKQSYQLAPFDATATVAGVRTALGKITSDVLATVEGAAGPPTLDALCERITAEHYTLLHLVCHGRYKSDDRETILYLAKADNTVDPVSGKRFLERLSKLRGARGLPHFAFLSACESASPEASAALGGLAQRMVHATELGMPAVLAMTDKVSVVTAQKLAEVFYGRLRDHGELDRALVEACAGLADRPDINVPALYSRLGGRPLFSDTLDRPLTNAEIEYGLSRAKDLLGRRAPSLLPDFDKQVQSLRTTLHAEFEELSKTERKEREQELDVVSNICDEVLDIGFNALALGKEPPAYDERCPFRGLYPFRVEDREFFFGREALVARLEERLAENNFLAVLGPSGSGKSSLVLAGLIPGLQKQEGHLQWGYLTPGSEPPYFLEASLKVNEQAALLVVDQFEELFTLCTDESQRRSFLDRLLKLPNRMRVVLTMRADFWGECAQYRELKEVMQVRQELIAPMDAAELRRAMEEQAKKVGLRFEADLSNTILDDVQGEPGAMPLLQHALRELWKRRHGRWLRAAEYRAIGGVKEAIGGTAEAVYRDLSFQDQHRVRDIFVRLTRLDEADERRDTRQRVRLAELTPARSDPAPTKALVKRLADQRLIVTSVGARGREEVEVAHEALIRYWRRLRQWLDEDRTDLRVLASVRLAAQEWQKNQADESLLTHHGSRLSEAEGLLSHLRLGLNREEAEYLRACKNRQERQAQRERRYRRWIVGVSVGGTIIAVMLAAWAWYQRNQALDQKSAADAAKIETQTTFAKELFRPLGRQPGGLTPSEVSALAALASLSKGQERVRVFFIEMALADSESARRFAARYPAAVQATVGLNPGLAEQAAVGLRKRLDDPEESIPTRTAAALAIAELDLADPELGGLAAGVLVESLRVGEPESVVATGELVRNLLKVARDIPPAEAANHLGQAAKLLAEAMAKSGLAEAMAKSGPMAFGLMEADPSHWEVLARALAEVCKALPPERAAHLDPAARLLAEALAKAKRFDRQYLASAPGDVCRAMRPDPAAKFLAEAMAKETDCSTLAALAKPQGEICMKMPPDRAATYIDPAAELLAKAMANEANRNARPALAHALAEVCKALRPERAATHFDPAAELLAEDMEANFIGREGLVRALLDVCKALPTERAAKHLDPAAKLLIEDLANKKTLVREGLLHVLVEVFKALPAELAAKHLDSAAKLLAEALAKANPDGVVAHALAQVFKALPAELAAKHLDSAAKLLAEALAKAPNAVVARALAQVCKALPAELAAKHLDPAAKHWTEALANEANPAKREGLAGTLVDVCKALPAERAATHLDPAAKLLVEARAKAKPFDRQYLARALVDVCKAMRPDPAAKFLAEAMAKETDDSALAALANALGEVCMKIPADRAATYLDPAAELLAKAMPTQSLGALEGLARALGDVCRALPAERAAKHLDPAAKFLVEALAKGTNWRAREELLRVLVEVCGAMPAERAATDLDPAAKLLAEALAIDPDSTRRAVVAARLGLVYKQLPADKAIPYLLAGLAQYPQTYDTFLSSLSDVAGRQFSLADVVEGLKHPVCYGEARKIFLQRAEQLTRQQFKTRWDMVAWHIKNHPETYPSTPPRELE
jgi:hypothetical protein